MKKAIIWWLFSIMVACAAIVGLIQYGDNDILNLILLLLLLLSLLGGGSKATVTTVKAKRSGQASEEKWLNEHHWEKNVSAQYKNWSLYVNNPSEEVAIFHRNSGKSQPDRLIGFKNVKESGIYQEATKGKNTVRLVVQFMNGKPYVMPVTDKPLAPDNPELQRALEFAKKVNDLFSAMASGNAMGNGYGKRYVIAKCYNCGQLLRGEAGKSGWCPKCKAAVQMPKLIL